MNLQVNLRELKEQSGLSERAGQCIVQIVKLARNERGKKLCQIFRKEENEVYIESLTKWDAQLKGLAMLERRCQELMEEVEFLSENQEVLDGFTDTKVRMQSKAPEEYYKTNFEKLRELEEQKSKEALILIEKNKLMKYGRNERHKTRV